MTTAAVDRNDCLLVLKEKDEVREYVNKLRRANKGKIALVPTMGMLHEGHLQLIRRAKKEADVVICSIYVNQTQFAPGEDYAAYPRDESGDLDKLRALECDSVFMPKQLFDEQTGVGGGNENGGGNKTWVTVTQLQDPLCGRTRPIFFRGVATVVCKLFNIVRPDVAVFGRKDFQQLRIIQTMVVDLDLDVEIVGVDIAREADGLAISSRNIMLSPVARKNAVVIHESLRHAAEAAQNDAITNEVSGITMEVARKIEESGGKVDYVEIVESEDLRVLTSFEFIEVCEHEPSSLYRRGSPSWSNFGHGAPERRFSGNFVILAAAKYGGVRLIDNVEFSVSTSDHNETTRMKPFR